MAVGLVERTVEPLEMNWVWQTVQMPADVKDTESVGKMAVAKA